MVLDIEQHLDAEIPRDMSVNHSMIGGCVSHQLHRLPVLPTGLRRQIQPGEARQLMRQLGTELTSQPAVMIRHLRTGLAAAGMTEKRHVLPARQSDGVVCHDELTKLGESDRPTLTF